MVRGGKGMRLTVNSNNNNKLLLGLMIMFHAIFEFVQSRDCVVHSQNPELLANLEVAQA